jgi:hypothetical protein
MEQAARERPFAWGQHDCCTWAAECVRALTGRDPLHQLGAAWADEQQAREVLASLGGLHAAVCAALGQPLAAPTLAQRGDVVLLAAGNTLALGVCMGEWIVAPGPTGLARVHVAASTGDTRPLAAWRI